MYRYNILEISCREIRGQKVLFASGINATVYVYSRLYVIMIITSSL